MLSHLLLYLHSSSRSIKKVVNVSKIRFGEYLFRFFNYLCHSPRVD